RFEHERHEIRGGEIIARVDPQLLEAETIVELDAFDHVQRGSPRALGLWSHYGEPVGEPPQPALGQLADQEGKCWPDVHGHDAANLRRGANTPSTWHSPPIVPPPLLPANHCTPIDRPLANWSCRDRRKHHRLIPTIDL